MASGSARPGGRLAARGHFDFARAVGACVEENRGRPTLLRPPPTTNRAKSTATTRSISTRIGAPAPAGRRPNSRARRCNRTGWPQSSLAMAVHLRPRARCWAEPGPPSVQHGPDGGTWLRNALAARS
eukprot:4279665-Pyramimonas_sp.AAC.1